jgi:hypothetical protein
MSSLSGGPAKNRKGGRRDSGESKEPDVPRRDWSCHLELASALLSLASISLGDWHEKIRFDSLRLGTSDTLGRKTSSAEFIFKSLVDPLTQDEYKKLIESLNSTSRDTPVVLDNIILPARRLLMEFECHPLRISAKFTLEEILKPFHKIADCELFLNENLGMVCYAQMRQLWLHVFPLQGLDFGKAFNSTIRRELSNFEKKILVKLNNPEGQLSEFRPCFIKPSGEQVYDKFRPVLNSTPGLLPAHAQDEEPKGFLSSIFSLGKDVVRPPASASRFSIPFALVAGAGSGKGGGDGLFRPLLSESPPGGESEVFGGSGVGFASPGLHG